MGIMMMNQWMEWGTLVSDKPLCPNPPEALLPAPSAGVWCTSPQALRHGLQLAPSTIGGRITCDWMRRSRWSSQKKTGWRRSIGWLKRWTSFRMVLVFVLMSYTIPGLKKKHYVEPTFHSDRKRSQDTRLSVHLSSSYHWQRLLPKKWKWFSSCLLLCARAQRFWDHRDLTFGLFLFPKHPRV